MKTPQLLFLALIPIFFSYFAAAQCPMIFVSLQSQQEVDDFGSTYSTCQTIDAYFKIGPSDDIVDLSPLSNISTLNNGILISDNEALTSLNGLHNISSVSGSVLISGNPKLKSLTSFGKNVSIDGFLYVSDNAILETLFNTGNIASAKGGLYIEDNVSLTSLNGLQNLTSSGPEISIKGNNKLTSLEGIHNINPQSFSDLTITDNIMLTICDYPNICTYLQGSGSRTISNNSEDCNSVMEIKEACIPKVIKAGYAENIELWCPVPYSQLSLPEYMTVTFDDNHQETIAVTWSQPENFDLSTGPVTLSGILSLPDNENPGDLVANITIKLKDREPFVLRHVSGIQFGDTLHIAECRPPRISKNDLDLGQYRQRSSLASRIITQEIPLKSPRGLWKILRYEYEVTERCGNTENFHNYVALYDLNPPEFRNFPSDTTISSARDLPPVDKNVEAFDLCRYVVWDSVSTSPVIDNITGDAIAFVRRWMAEDEVGNRSFRDQMIYIDSTDQNDLGGITAHIAKEADMIDAHFPGTAGTNDIHVTLYRIDTTALDSTEQESTLTGNWQGSNGNFFFTPLLPGPYSIRIDVPTGYAAMDADSTFRADGWSDTLQIGGGSMLDLGTILLIPIPDTTLHDPMVSDSADADIALNGLYNEQNDIIDAGINPKVFRLYPNPTTGKVNILMEGQKTVDIIVYNHLGQRIKSGYKWTNSEIDLSGLATGMYFVSIGSDHRYWTTEKVLLISQ